jgi:hypothetical protein
MISVKTKKLKEAGLLDYLSGISGKDGFIGILGGHFILDYNRDRNELAPLIVEDITDDEFRLISNIEAGDFPLCSFKYGLHLHKSLSQKNIDSRIIILVNDHKTPFLAANKKQELLPQLRNQYFINNKLPESYVDLLRKEMLSPSDVLLRNILKIENQNRDSYLFSEKYFRKRFDRSLKEAVLETDGFFSMEGSSGKSEVYINLTNGNNFCLSEKGKCGCSGEVMQFIFSMVSTYNILDFVLFIPHECALGVSNGIYAILHFLEMKNIEISVKMITSLPCDNHNKLFTDQEILIEEFETNLKKELISK